MKLIINLKDLDHKIRGELEIQKDFVDTHIGKKEIEEFTNESYLQLYVKVEDIKYTQGELIKDSDELLERVSFEYEFDSVHYSKFGILNVTLSEPTSYIIKDGYAIFDLEF